MIVRRVVTINLRTITVDQQLIPTPVRLEKIPRPFRACSSQEKHKNSGTWFSNYPDFINFWSRIVLTFLSIS
jgi:hypothetical protein